MMDVDIVVSLVWCGSFFVSTSCSKLSCRLCSIMLALPTVRHFLQVERGGGGGEKRKEALVSALRRVENLVVEIVNFKTARHRGLHDREAYE